MHLLDEAANQRNSFTRNEPEIMVEVRKAIFDGLHSETGVARVLQMSSATLRRRLSVAGTSFRTVQDEIQRSTVETLLMTDKSLDDIASEVRYSDVRSFRRACRRWFGTTPGAYRRAGDSNSRY